MEYKLNNQIDLRQGDCIELMKNIPDQSIDLVCTDLPYFKVVDNKWDNEWDNNEDYLSWVEDNIKEVKRIIKPNGSIFLFTSRQLNKNIGISMDEYFIEQRVIIWKRKRNMSNTRGRAMNSGYEPILYYSNSESPTYNNIKVPPEKHLQKRKEYISGHLKDGVAISDVWDISALPHNSKEKVDHPTQKPIKLIERIILMASNENDTVLDFTMGSGTTGIACMNTNRKFIGIELNEDYFLTAKKRFISN
tara:strand:+ start:26648 stop:27391 length:744 start_codon:yes stop_codon:yes gene_type:complete